MVGVEGFVTAVVDFWPWFRKGWRKEIFIGITCIGMFLVGIPMTMQVHTCIIGILSPDAVTLFHEFSYLWDLWFMIS